MGSMSLFHWIIVIVVVVVLFGGAGRLPRLGEDLAKGLKAFKRGLHDDDKTADEKKELDRQPPV